MSATNLPKRMRPKIDECPSKIPKPIQAADSLTIEIPMPPKATHPNARPSRRAEISGKKRQREEAFIAALGALSDRGWLSPSKRPNWQRATIQATFYKPGSQAKLSDSDNNTAWLKGTCDGLQDAQVITNDRGFIWQPAVEILGREAGTRAKVVIVITKAE